MFEKIVCGKKWTLTKLHSPLKWIGKSKILSGEFEEHRIVEKLVDGHVLTETLAATSLDHKLASQMSRRLRLQGPQNDALVQWISRYNLPMMKHRKAKGLTLCVSPQIGLEAKRVDCRDKGFDDVQRGARDGSVLCNVASATSQNAVNSRNAVGGRLYFYEQVGLHEARSCHQKSRVSNSAGGRDNLASSPVNRFIRYHSVEDFKLGVPILKKILTS